MGYTSIVVGTDGSDTAERAVREASGLAADQGARLVVVSAYQASGTPSSGIDAERMPSDIRYPLTDRAQAEELAERGRSIAREEGVATVVVQALEGDPSKALLEAAKDFDVDLIVVGSRGLTSHGHFILGSVASSVGHHAACDVLVAHTTKVDA